MEQILILHMFAYHYEIHWKYNYYHEHSYSDMYFLVVVWQNSQMLSQVILSALWGESHLGCPSGEKVEYKSNK